MATNNGSRSWLRSLGAGRRTDVRPTYRFLNIPFTDRRSRWLLSVPGVTRRRLDDRDLKRHLDHQA